jgi:hypothetical protein
MLLLEKLKQDLETLDDAQLRKVEIFLGSIVSSDSSENGLLKQKRLQGEGRAKALQSWVDEFAASSGVSLSDEAFDRGSIYRE